MQLIDNFDPIIGDNLGYATMPYNRVPAGYGFDTIAPKADCPLTTAKWAELIDFAQRYYAKFEIVGDTLTDFKDNLQTYYDKGADTFERVLEVYDDDIAKPILGRTEKVTYDEKNTENESSDNTGTTSGTNNNQQDVIDVPVDASDPNTQTPSQVIKDNGGNESENTNEYNRDYEHTHTGTVVTELSDLGVRPNYESLNGFIDNNRTYYDVFVWLFRDCFQIADFLVW